MDEKVKAALDQIRPALQADGGRELVSIEDGTVNVKVERCLRRALWLP